MNIELKVKACSLAAEARIIRKLANILRNKQKRAREQGDLLTDEHHRLAAVDRAKSLREQRLNITDHRRTVVRTEARATHLARAFIGGMPYKRVEAKCWTQPDWQKVLVMVKKYMVPDQDNRPLADRIKDWREAA